MAAPCDVVCECQYPGLGLDKVGCCPRACRNGTAPHATSQYRSYTLLLSVAFHFHDFMSAVVFSCVCCAAAHLLEYFKFVLVHLPPAHHMSLLFAARDDASSHVGLLLLLCPGNTLVTSATPWCSHLSATV